MDYFCQTPLPAVRQQSSPHVGQADVDFLLGFLTSHLDEVFGYLPHRENARILLVNPVYSF
jgi:hypothetical protein